MAAERRIALCVARFYEELADRLEQGAALSVELPLIAKLAAESGRFDGVVCLGAVIRGETDHYDFVCAGASDGILRVSLDTGVPCGFGVLTVDTMEQALARVRGGARRDTGRHAVEAVLACLAVGDALDVQQA
jgi:6,7-dimethyl-8-ribityllumazine synthase